MRRYFSRLQNDVCKGLYFDISLHNVYCLEFSFVEHILVQKMSRCLFLFYLALKKRQCFEKSTFSLMTLYIGNRSAEKCVTVQ
jgi:hypothetical protein